MKSHFLSLFLVSFIGITLLVPLTTIMMPTAVEATHTNKRTLFQWHNEYCGTQVQCETLQSQTEAANLGNSQYLIFHYKGTQTPTQRQIDTMDATAGFTDTQKGMLGTSLAQLETLADVVQANWPGGFLGYQLQSSLSPSGEFADPLGSYQDAKAIADEHGLQLFAYPSWGITNTDVADDIAGLAAVYLVQVQGFQDDDSNCSTLASEAKERAGFIRQTYEHKVIMYELSLTSNPAPGKNTKDTVIDCMDATTPGTGSDSLSGAGVFWAEEDISPCPEGGPTCERWRITVEYHEETYGS